MKTLIAMICLFLSFSSSIAQEYIGSTNESSSKPLYAQPIKEKMAVSVGLFKGGGLVGLDLEILAINDQIGVQAGLGFVGYNAGITFHLEEGIRTSYILLNFMQTGKDNLYLQAVGGSYNYRGKKWFTASLGLAMVTEMTQRMSVEAYKGRTPTGLVTFSVGAYIPM